MYIRWQSRERRSPQFGRGKQLHRKWDHKRQRADYAYARKGTSKQDIHWRAILVENERVNGKPTQRHIAYLVGFTESAIAIPAATFPVGQNQ